MSKYDLSMKRLKAIAIISTLTFGLMACEGPTSVRVVDSPAIEQTLFDGRGINVSRKSNTTVSLSSITTAEPNSTQIEVFIVARNSRSSPFILSTSSIAAQVDGVAAKIFTYEELKAAEVRSRNIALIATAIGGAANAYSASQPQTTTGTYNYGGTYGTYSGTTYNPAASTLATAAVTANTNAQINTISSNSDRTLGQLQETYLKPTTMNRGMEYGGVLRIEVPRLSAESTQDILLTINLGTDIHTFELVRGWDITQ
ncbi:hypothetical protein [Yoonia algicola]|uniref:Lipoprotein n=1 Tax=Yoonia algicola TaxID=3137368 RepID=A0AAN0MGD7_9RHOB